MKIKNADRLKAEPVSKVIPGKIKFTVNCLGKYQGDCSSPVLEKLM